MNVGREGKLKNSDINTGDTLHVQLYTEDVRALTVARYCMSRFMDFGNGYGVAGWAGEDKIHMYLEDPELSPDPEALVNLSLDPGGDLYFTIWENEQLKQAKGFERFDRESILTNDPNERLKAIGIEFVQLINLDYLAHYLEFGEKKRFFRKSQF